MSQHPRGLYNSATVPFQLCTFFSYETESDLPLKFGWGVPGQFLTCFNLCYSCLRWVKGNEMLLAVSKSLHILTTSSDS